VSGEQRPHGRGKGAQRRTLLEPADLPAEIALPNYVLQEAGIGSTINKIVASTAPLKSARRAVQVVAAGSARRVHLTRHIHLIESGVGGRAATC
jgi:hypothetical protein